MDQDMILIVDLGSRENDRLAGEIREMGVASRVCSHHVTLEEVLAMPGIKGIILNGGPDRMENGEEKDVGLDIYNCDLPVLLVGHRGDAPWPEDELERKNILRGFVFGFCGIEEK